MAIEKIIRFEKRKILIYLLLLLTLYGLIVVTAYYSQASIIFRSSGASFSPPSRYDIDEVFIPTEDGLGLYGWWLKTKGAKRTVLYCQGNGRNVSFQNFRLNTFLRMGANAFLFDYRGFGKSPGRIQKEQDIYDDVMAAYRYLNQILKIPEREIIVWGKSLGGAVAVEVAVNRQPGALILESTFYSMEDVARDQYWFLPTQLLLRFHFKSGIKIKLVRSPVIVLHSPSDRYIPFTHGKRLFNAASEPKVLMETFGSHFDFFDLNEAVMKQLMEHLDRLMA